nr:977_t:CDS:2 [Entrophospora candida]CAG8483725.1 3014_t:CDS:2 [Entrophospora candida]
MHPNLAYHEHPKCLDIILRFEECHRASFFNRIFGRCNSLKRELNACLSAEFEEKRLKSAERSREVRKNYQKIWKELDELEATNKK